MNNLGTEFRVGIFTLLGLSATIFAIFVINPSWFEREDTKLHYTILDDASGIMTKTHVKTNGVNVGNVRTVELVANATKVTFTVRADVQIPKGSTIEVRTVGFLGDKFLEIKRVDSTELLAEGELIPRDLDVVDLNEVINTVGKIAKDIKHVTESLANVLGGEKGEKGIAEIVENIRSITEEAKLLVAENRTDLRTIVENTKSFTKSIDEFLDVENRERMDRIIASFDDSMLDVKDAAKNINLIAGKIEKGEGTIGKLINDEKTMEELDGAIKDLRKVLSPVSNLQVAVDFHTELRRFTPDLETYESAPMTQNYFNLKLSTRPGADYIIGFTDVSRTQIDTTIENVPDIRNEDVQNKANATRTKRTVREKANLRFNLQLSRRWYATSIRLGLFESTGGVGGDLHFLNDKLKLSLDAYEFVDSDSEIRKLARLKTYASALFFNHVYAMIGLDDITRRDYKNNMVDEKRFSDLTDNFFVGAGVTFNDQDLKSLFGIMSLARP